MSYNKRAIVMPYVNYAIDSDELLKVDRNSHKYLRNIVYKIAKYFNKEERYDFIPYSPENTDNVSYLFLDRLSLIYESNKLKAQTTGAISFTKRRTQNMNTVWTLDWVWLHPFDRRKGILFRHWHFFESYHSGFIITPPISNAMCRFLEKLKENN